MPQVTYYHVFQYYTEEQYIYTMDQYEQYYRSQLSAPSDKTPQKSTEKSSEQAPEQGTSEQSLEQRSPEETADKTAPQQVK